MKLRYNNIIKNPEYKNQIFLIAEFIWGGFFLAVASFGAVYAIRLGATDQEVGFLTAFPALITASLAIPFGSFLQKTSRPNRWIPISLVLQRVLFLSIILIPIIFHNKTRLGTVVVVVIILTTIPQILYNLTIFPFYMRVVKEEHRISFFSATHFTSNLITGVVVGLAGIILDRQPFPLNYQIIFMTGSLLSLISLVCFYNVRDPHTGQRFILAKSEHKKVKNLNLVQMINLRSDFGRVVLNQFVQYIGLWAATPVIIIYIVNHLNASDSWFGLYNSLLFWGLLIGWVVARTIVKKFGEPTTLKWSSHLPSLQPLLIGLSATLAPILFINLFTGLVSPVYGLSHNNSLLKAFPPGQEHQALALYSTISRIGVFSFSLLGVSILNFTDNIRLVLIVCGIISLLGSLTFHIFPVFPNIATMNKAVSNHCD